MNGGDIGIYIWIGGYLFIALICAIIYILPESEESKLREKRRNEYHKTLADAKRITKEVMDKLK